MSCSIAATSRWSICERIGRDGVRADSAKSGDPEAMPLEVVHPLAQQGEELVYLRSSVDPAPTMFPRILPGPL